MKPTIRKIGKWWEIRFRLRLRSFDTFGLSKAKREELSLACYRAASWKDAIEQLQATYEHGAVDFAGRRRLLR